MSVHHLILPFERDFLMDATNIQFFLEASKVFHTFLLCPVKEIRFLHAILSHIIIPVKLFGGIKMIFYLCRTKIFI